MFPKFVDWMAWVWYLPFNPPEVGALSCQFCRWLAIECDFLTSNTWGGCHLLIFTSDGSICQPSEGNDLSLSLLVRMCEYGSLGLWAVVLHILYHCLEIFIDITDLKLPDYRRIVWHFLCSKLWKYVRMPPSTICTLAQTTIRSHLERLTPHAMPPSLSHLVQRTLVAFSSSPGHHCHGPGNIIATLLLMVATGLSLPWILFH